MSESGQERRKHKRYVADFKIYFDTPYDVKKKVMFTVKGEGATGDKKYLAFTKNVSTEGVCFVSHKSLDNGSLLSMEVHLDDGSKPVVMEGEVRWCRQAKASGENKSVFDSGIRIIKVNGASVFDSIHFNESRNSEWSNVLEAVFGQNDKLV